MPQITRTLLRKRAEHNEGLIATLEEISLHQEELESINEVLGMTCRKLKILYLQNNIIPKMENLYHMKDLVYLNLALNNITKIEGLHNCEFLKKLDLTVNFVDFDTLKESIEHLQSRENLQELYMMGNPSEHGWDQFKFYVIAKLPQLQTLDGTEITKSMQIQARQKLPSLEVELEKLAQKVSAEKAAKVASTAVVTAKVSVPHTEDKSGVTVEDVEEGEEGEEVGYDGNEMTDNTPESRVKIYQELAAQKKEKEDRANVNAPRKRDYEAEQAESIKSIREKEQEAEQGEIRQKNEGGWEFYWDEESRPGVVVLEVRVQKFLDSSLIDVDVHPTYVSMVIKSKVLRLRLPAEVRVSESKCQRSKTNGALLIIMPKMNPAENAISLRADQRARDGQAHATSNVTTTTTTTSSASIKNYKSTNYNYSSTPTVAIGAVTAGKGGKGEKGMSSVTAGVSANTRTTFKPKKLSLHEQMLQDARDAQAATEGSISDNNRNDALLDANIGASATVGATVASIVKRKPEPESLPLPTVANDTIFRASNRVVELD